MLLQGQKAGREPVASEWAANRRFITSPAMHGLAHAALVL